jgi:hypothetical protein
MQRPTFADPKTEFAFKRIFGSEQHKDVLVAFLNDMLDLEGPRRIVGVELTDARRRELASMNTSELVALLARLDERKRWT